MKKIIFLFLAVFCLALVIPEGAKAYEIRTDNSIEVSSDQTIDGNLYATGNTLVIEGTVNGDVFFAGNTMTINGKISGDVFATGQLFNIGGEIDGSVRAAGNSMIVNGDVKQNIAFLGNTFSLQDQGNIGWDLFIVGASANVSGNIGRNFHGSVAEASISGNINENVQLKMANNKRSDDDSALKIAPTAQIGGDVNYTAASQAQVAEGANISGELNFNEKQVKDFNYLNWGYWLIFSIFAALVVGLVMISLWRNVVIGISDKMSSQIPVALGWGVVLMIVSPIISILLLFTLIGIPLALIIFVAWLIVLYLGKIFAGILIGRMLVEKLWSKKKDSLIWSMIIGIVITWLVFSIPLIGWAISLLAIWWGIGGIWLYFKEK